MTTERRLERDLPQILGDLAMGPYPDYIDDVLADTAQRRQRPAWTFPERWLPMDIVTTRVPTTALPLRQFGVLALIALLAAAALAVFVGAQARLPAPFGPAANGLIAYSDMGDIFTLDPVNGATRAVVTGPEFDHDPVWSRSGTHLVFERREWTPAQGSGPCWSPVPMAARSARSLPSRSPTWGSMASRRTGTPSSR